MTGPWTRMISPMNMAAKVRFMKSMSSCLRLPHQLQFSIVDQVRRAGCRVAHIVNDRKESDAVSYLA
jgi:hypothetical protein